MCSNQPDNIIVEQEDKQPLYTVMNGKRKQIIIWLKTLHYDVKR